MIRLAASRPDWLLGFEDEVWFSRLARPPLHAWSEADQPLRLQQLAVPKEDADPKALACYGLLVRGCEPDGGGSEQIWLRFVDGRPVSSVTVLYLAWCLGKAASLGKKVLVLIWDNAPWHVSQAVRGFIRRYNRGVKQRGEGVRLVVCCLPSKSPWLNPIEPKWVHGKRRVVEPDRLLTAKELAQRVCNTFACAYEAHLSVAQ